MNLTNYSRQELVSMTYAIGESHGNCLLASRLYAQKYPDRRHPQVICFEKLKDRFERTANANYEKKTRSKSVLHEENELNITLSVVENPEISVRELSKNLDIGKSSISKSLKNNKMHPYHVQLHQDLSADDYIQRVNFCRTMQNKLQENNQFPFYILFTDECTFHRNGFVNRHNFHYYATENPHLVHVNHFQQRWSLNVWGGIVGNYVIGPHFFEGRVNGDAFYNFLNEDFPLLIQCIPEEIREQMWLQMDGATPHFYRQVREHVTAVFPQKWIGRGGPIAWPARSPDLTSLDFFLWGFVKSAVYKTPATTREDMKNRITEAFQSVTPIMLQNVRTSFRNRLQACLNQNGRHFEHML